MVKKTYIGVNNTSKSVKKMYIGVNGVARKVTKAYRGVDGVAKLVFTQEVGVSITFNANGGTGTMAVLTGNTVTLPSNGFTRTGYKFKGWNTSADGSGTSYSEGQTITLTDSLTLYATWIQVFTVVYRATNKSDWHGDSDTGPMELYALWIDGVEQDDLGAFSGAYRTYPDLPYGTTIKVYVGDKYGKNKSYVHVNGTAVTGSGNSIEYTMTLTSNLDINMEWNTDGLSFYNPGSWWRCFITTS